MKTAKAARKQIEREIGALYRRAEGIDLSSCAYCGFQRESLDHSPPLKYAAGLGVDGRRKFVKEGGKFVLYPSCKTCNGFLGSKPLCTYGERLAYLYRRYGQAIDKAALWSADDIEDLGYNLKVAIEQQRQTTKLYISKLRGIENSLLFSPTDE